MFFKLISTFFIISSCQALTDLTLKEKAIGRDVVCAVIKKITDSAIFPDDKGILRRMAWVESMFGYNSSKFNDENYGGIWQVNQSRFDEIVRNNSKYPQLSKDINSTLSKINSTFKIDLKRLEYPSLLKPLYSGLFARLVLLISPGDIPENFELESQASYWKRYYDGPKGKNLILLKF